MTAVSGADTVGETRAPVTAVAGADTLRSRAHRMGIDTKWVVGTGVAVILSVVGTGVALGVFLLSGVNARFDDVNARFDDVNARFDDVNARIDDLRTELIARVDDLRTELTTRIEAVEGSLAGVRTDLRRFDDRLRAVEIAFGQVDQRLETLERLHLPAGDAR